MIIVDNKIQVAKIKLAYLVTLPIGLLLVFLTDFITFNETEALVSNIIGGLLIIAFALLILIKPQYFYFAVENNSKIVIRIYHAFPFFRKYKAFEMNVANLHDYELKQSFLGLIKSIQFSVLAKNKVGKYPPINLVLVTEKEIKSLIGFLNKILPPAKRK